MMWGQNVNMAAGQMEFILYGKNYSVGDDVNCEVKLTCFLYKVSVKVKEFIAGNMIYIFNRSWDDNRRQQYITHLHTNITHTTEKGK
jgi:hypothetical protein